MFSRQVFASSTMVTATLGIASSVIASPELATLAQVQWGINGSIVTGTSAATNSDGYAMASSNFSGTATATANFGVLGVFADASASDSPYLISLASGTAGFTDTMTITGGTGDSTTNFTFHINGSSSFTGNGTVLATLSVLRTDTLQGDINFELNPGDFDFTTTDIPFIYDVPFEIAVILSVQASFTLDFLNSQQTASGTAIGMYDHTITLTGVNVNNNQSFSLTSGSGTSYPLPEPTTSALLAIGSVAFFRRHRRT